MALLIINADDYGLTEATSQAILDCHRRGLVTSTSVLTLAPGFETTAHLLAEHPGLGVGVHLALVGEDPPLTEAHSIPTLVDERGALPPSWREFVRRSLLGRIDPVDVERELSAQVDRALASGASVTHLDSHQHLHEWPTLWPIVQRLAAQAGVDAVRTTRAGWRSAVGALGHLAARRVRRCGLKTTDHFAGFAESGHLSERCLLHLIESLPRSGSVEIGCHPGSDDDPDRDRYRWGFEWGAEADALLSPAVRRLVESRCDRLGTFGDL